MLHNHNTKVISHKGVMFAVHPLDVNLFMEGDKFVYTVAPISPQEKLKKLSPENAMLIARAISELPTFLELCDKLKSDPKYSHDASAIMDKIMLTVKGVY